MPSIAERKSKNALAVHDKHRDLISKYSSHHSEIEALQKLAKSHILEDVASQLDLNDEGRARVLVYLSDFANLFRFYRRSRYDDDQAVNLLTATILWRMRTDLDLLSLSSLNPLYVTPPAPNPPLFWVNSGFADFYGRPCGVINLRSVERTAENTLDELKEYIVACMEIMRRYVADLYRNSVQSNNDDKQSDETVLQASIAIDLAHSGMANLELELLPFLLDLLKNHLPGMIGAVYVLNYGWVHAGMWAVIKRVLPQQALAKIFFPSHEELKEHFDVKCIPKCYGGELDVAVESGTNDVLRKYGRPRRVSSAAAAVAGGTPPHSPGIAKERGHMSRTNSYDSIYEVFYSADSTPWASRPITPRQSEPSTPRGDHFSSSSSSSSTAGLTMTPSAARKLNHLQMSRGDLSCAAENAHEPGVRAAGRSRSGSEVRIVDGKAVGLSVSVGSSPFVTPAMTPVGGLSPRLTRRPDRHVRFSSSRDRSASPARRIGATTSSFKLYLNQDEEAVLPSESEDSDASGKDGELPPATESGGGLFGRLRRLSETRFTGGSGGEKEKEKEKEKVKGMGEMEEQADGTIMYIEPPSPRLQVAHLEEEPLQHLPHPHLSRRTRRSARDGLVSPYNKNNPFFGYPATFRLNANSNANATANAFATPQHLHSRRRKRDLLRTLTYLFVLRILAFHRRLRWRVALVYREVARTISVGGDAGRGEEEFWRDLDIKRLKSEENEARRLRGEKDASVGFKVVREMLGAMVVLLVLRPQWRRAMSARVYASIIGARRAEGDGSVNWDEWEKAPSVPAKSRSQAHSWTGLGIRKRLGLQSDATAEPKVTSAAATGGKDGRGGRNGRMNALAVAGGLISAASLGYLLYTYLVSSSSSSPSGNKDDDDDDDVSRRRSSLKPPSSSRASRVRPSLSLCLSTSFTRDTDSIAHLRSLLETLAPLYVVHLIVPSAPTSPLDVAASISQLTTQLGEIQEFDARRVLEYSQVSGRFALSRALACDCHVEVALPGSNEATTMDELSKIRRGCGLVVFANLANGTEAEGGRSVLEALRRAAADEGREAPSGMRAFDLSRENEPWSQLAQRLETLRQGWR